MIFNIIFSRFQGLNNILHKYAFKNVRIKLSIADKQYFLNQRFQTADDYLAAEHTVLKILPSATLLNFFLKKIFSMEPNSETDIGNT
jgi:hypothetical protein